MNILLIEPDKILAHNYGIALKNAGHTVTWVNNAQAAIHAIDESVPTVIVLELQLAMHNGIEFLYELRSYAEWQHIPVIIQSMVDRVRLGSVEYMFEGLGIVDYLYKPVTKLRHLVYSVERAVQPATV